MVFGVALSGDRQRLASGGEDGTVRLWDPAASGRGPLATLQGHTGTVLGVALSGDGQLVASGGVDGTIRLWEAGGGACLRTLRPDRRCERLDITGLTGVTEAQRAALLALGATEQAPASSSAPARA
jgi:WD40 repeat protein